MRVSSTIQLALAIVLVSSLALKVFAATSTSKSSIAAPNSSPECSKVHDELGQLFYIGVYGYKGHNPPGLAIQQEYINLVRELNIGAVLPHVDSDDPQAIARSSHALQAAAEGGASHLPAILGIDYDSMKTQNQKLNFGLGYGSGLIGKYGGNLSNQCFNDLIFLDAYLHKAMGLNQSLGPTIERNPHGGFLSQDSSKVMPLGNAVFDTFHQMGLGVTAKHFPYTPSDYNLHNKSEDTHVPESDVLGLLESFRQSAPAADFVMTTHLMNSNVDSKDMVTFSDKWIKILREKVGFQGLIVTDGLFMIDRYSASVVSMASNWKGPQFNNTKSIFAARALLAGHDMVFLEGDAASTREVFRDLQGLACGNSEIGQKLRHRIFESFKRVETYKKKHLKSLSQGIAPDPQLIGSASELYKKVSNGTSCGSPEMQQFRKQIAKLGIQTSEEKRVLAEVPCEPAKLQIEPNIIAAQKVIDQLNGAPEAERKAFILRHLAAPADKSKLAEVCDLSSASRKFITVSMSDLDPALFTFPEGLEAIGCVSTSDPQVRAKVVEALKNPAASMRSMAVETLDQLGSVTPEEQDLLLKYVNDPDASIRFNAIMALGKGSPRTDKTRHELLGLLDSPSLMVKQAAGQALYENPDPAGADQLMEAFQTHFRSLNPELVSDLLWNVTANYGDNPKLFNFMMGILADPKPRPFLAEIQSTVLVTAARMLEKLPKDLQAKGNDRFYTYMQAHKNDPQYQDTLTEAVANLKSDDVRIQKLGAELMAREASENLVYVFESRALQPGAAQAMRDLMKKGKNLEIQTYSALSLTGSLSHDPALKAEVEAKIAEALKSAKGDSDFKNRVVSMTTGLNESGPELQKAVVQLLVDPNIRSSAASFFRFQTNKDPEALAIASKLASDYFDTAK